MKEAAADQKIREEALDPSQSFILEAPAGSGKTDLLTARFLVLLSRVSHPAQIMAVTFTRKAAAEMANRLSAVLRSAGEKGVKPANPWEGQLLALGRKVLRTHGSHLPTLFNPDSMRVGTFHSFCASIIRSWPLEAQVLPGADLLDDIDQEVALEAVVEQYLQDVRPGRATAEELEAYERRLAASNNHPATVSEQLRELLRRRDRLADLPIGNVDLQSLGSELHVRLQGYVGSFLSPLSEYFAAQRGAWNQLRRELGRGEGRLAGTVPEINPGLDLDDVSAWKNVATVFLTQAGTPRKVFPSKSGFPKDFGKSDAARWITHLPQEPAALLAHVAKWPDLEGDNVGLTELTDILILVAGGLRRLEESLRSQGMDYLELELATLRALAWAKRPSESLVFYHEHLRHVLVDEAQDLNDIQVRILGRLTEGWEPGDGRTVFMVGDPKQSIYRFRRAEVNLFYELRDKGLLRTDEAALPLKPLALSTNFRSRPHLVEFINGLFEEVMSSPRRDYDEVTFSPSKPHRPESPSSMLVTVAVFNDEEDGLAPLEREAEWVAHAVARLHQDRREETIAVLFAVRTHLATYVRALDRLEVPLRLMEGTLLKERPEVIHLLNLFTAMTRPFDDLAWAAAIRSPWLSVSNQLLCDLASGRGLWFQRILSSRETSTELSRFCAAITDAQKLFGREPYNSTMSRLWEDLDGPRSVSSQYGEQGVSNGMAFLDLLGLCSGLPAEDALLKLHRLVETAYAPGNPKGALSNVQMMTIHRAKGLEFDHVFAVNLDYDPLGGGKGEQPAYRMERLPGEERHFLFAATGDRRTGKQNLASFLLKDLEDRRALAEARRLLYVVTTRAKESLTLTGRGKRPSPDAEREEIPFKKPLPFLLKVAVKEELPLRLLFNPEPSGLSKPAGRAFTLQLAPPSFEAEALPYRMTSPSKLEDETFQAAEPGAEEEDGSARARGLVIHRILETLARKEPLPTVEAIFAALSAEGIAPSDAKGIAIEVLQETRAAWEAPDFRSLRDSAQEVQTEWALEDFDGDKNIRVGRFDLLLKVNDRWVVLDYKAGRPEGDVETWVRNQKRRYGPQLGAYVEMMAQMLSIPAENIRSAMLFTALPRLVWQEE